MTEAQKNAMQRGREKAAKRRRKDAIKRVAVFSAWSKADAAASERIANGHDVKRPSMPEIPSDSDYRVARGDE